MSNILANKLWDMVSSNRHNNNSEENCSSLPASPQTETTSHPEILSSTHEIRYLFRGRFSSSNSGSTSSHCQTPPPHQPPPPNIPAFRYPPPLADSVFLEDPVAYSPTLSSPSGKQSISGTVFTFPQPSHQAQRLSTLRDASQMRALSLDHFQFDLYQNTADNSPSRNESSTNNNQNHKNMTSQNTFSDNFCPTNKPISRRGQRGNLTVYAVYNFNETQLEITIIRATDLPAPRQSTRSKPISLHSSFKRNSYQNTQNLSNPYVRLQLLPNTDLRQRSHPTGGKEEITSMVTSVKRKTQSPIWNEKFVFPSLTFTECQRKSLDIVVRDCDKTAAQSLFGRVTIPLSETDVDLAAGEHITREIKSCINEPEDIGEVFVSLQYLPAAGRLTVDIIKARNLVLNDCNKKPDVMIKVCFMDGKKRLKSKRTSVKRSCLNPTFNESFRLNVTEESIKSTTCVVSVYDHRPTSKDNLIGRVVLGNTVELLHNSNRESRDTTKASHWSQLVQLPRTPVAMWHPLKSRTTESTSSISSIETNSST